MDKEVHRELSVLITKTSLALIACGVLLLFQVSSRIAFTVFVIIMMSSLYKSKILNLFFNKVVEVDMPKHRLELVNTICSLQNYQSKTSKWNGRRRALYNSLPSAHRKIAQELNYLQRVDHVDEAIKENSKIVADIAHFAVDEHQVLSAELRLAVPDRQNFRIIESLCHYQRDWSPEGEKEIKPILNYFLDSLKQIEKQHENVTKQNTAIIVPGSGLGRVAHELALQEYRQVHAVEYSLLMYLFNKFVYSDYNSNYTIYPFVHSYSHHISEDNQLRSISLKGGKPQPESLTLHCADFRKFRLPDSNLVDNVIVVTEFFIDTAENIFEYMDAIKSLIGDKNGYWINLGPLKYGSSPKIEPTLEEWRKIRALYGWKDIHETNPLDDQLIGYLTDKKSLWQGYYGVARWISKLSRN